MERFHLDAAGWFQAGEPVPHLTAVSDAVWEGRRLRMVYARDRDATVERVIDPLGVVLKGGVWYLVARSDDQTRTYRISRIADAETLPDRFERPNGFDLATYWTESSAAYEENAPRTMPRPSVHEIELGANGRGANRSYHGSAPVCPCSRALASIQRRRSGSAASSAACMASNVARLMLLANNEASMGVSHPRRRLTVFASPLTAFIAAAHATATLGQARISAS